MEADRGPRNAISVNLISGTISISLTIFDMPGLAGDICTSLCNDSRVTSHIGECASESFLVGQGTLSGRTSDDQTLI